MLVGLVLEGVAADAELSPAPVSQAAAVCEALFNYSTFMSHSLNSLWRVKENYVK